MKLRDYLNLEGNDELHMFLKTTKNKKVTAQMKYDTFVKNSLEKLRPVMNEYIEQWDKVFKDCVTVDQISKLVIPPLPPHILEFILQLIEKQRHLDIVEQTYLALDLIRAVSSNLAGIIGKAAIHYSRAIQMAPTIIRPDGKSF